MAFVGISFFLRSLQGLERPIRGLPVGDITRKTYGVTQELGVESSTVTGLAPDPDPQVTSMVVTSANLLWEVARRRLR